LTALVVALLFCAASASSSGSSSGSSSSSDEVVGWKVTLDSDTPVVPALTTGAQNAGCQASNPGPGKLVARCQDGAVAIIQEGREVLIGCQYITIDQCRAIFNRILDATPR
jgi:hypothetical protein